MPFSVLSRAFDHTISSLLVPIHMLLRNIRMCPDAGPEGLPSIRYRWNCERIQSNRRQSHRTRNALCIYFLLEGYELVLVSGSIRIYLKKLWRGVAKCTRKCPKRHDIQTVVVYLFVWVWEWDESRGREGREAESPKESQYTGIEEGT